MKISLQTMGSLGDVVPFISLAQGLMVRGHEVSLLAPKDYTDLINQHGVTAAKPPAFSVAAWLDEATRRGTINGPIKFFRDWNSMITPHVDDIMAACLAATQSADIVVANLICAPARVAAQYYGAPLIFTAFQPTLSATSKAPCVMLARRDWGPFNKLSYGMVTLCLKLVGYALRHQRRSLDQANGPALSDLRSHLGAPLPRITSMSPTILSKRPTDWDAASHLVPYWPIPPSTSWELEWDLKRDLEGGPAPICVGLGSMELKDVNRFMATVLSVAKSGGHRLIFAKKLVDQSGVDITGHLALDHAPHDRLLPHCAAIVHHGGAGTMDTALRAGCPQIILPHNLDQFWQGRQLFAKDLCPKPCPAEALSETRFASMLAGALSDGAKRQAKQAQTAALAQDGVSQTIEIIEHHCREFKPV